MLSLRLIVLICGWIFVQINAYCVYNDLPATEIWVQTYQQAMVVNRVFAGANMCCRWDDRSCYYMKGDPHRECQGCRTAPARYSMVFVRVACSKHSDNFQYTYVEMPAGGWLAIKSSGAGLDNWIAVHGHLNDDLYWYRCGTADEWHYY